MTDVMLGVRLPIVHSFSSSTPMPSSSSSSSASFPSSVLFPLSSIESDSSDRTSRVSQPRHRTQSRQHAAVIRQTSNQIIAALNTLYFNYPSLSSVSRLPRPSSVPSPAQHRMLDCIHSSAAAYLSSCRQFRRSLSSSNCKDRRGSASVRLLHGHSRSVTDLDDTLWIFDPPTSEESRTDSSYSAPFGSDTSLSAFDAIPLNASVQVPLAYNSASGITPLIASKVSLPASLNNRPITDLLPPHLLSVYTSAASLLVPPATATERLIKANLREPRVLADRSEYLLLVQRMLSLGMLSLTSSPQCINGLFGVIKDQSSIRLILDARPANCYFVHPPHTSLPSPAHLAALSVPGDSPLWVSKLDLSNFYHQLLLPMWLQSYFALPSLSVQELQLIDASTLSAELKVLLSSGLPLHPCCATLPMGWSHSVFVAQSIHEHILYSSKTLSPADNIVNLSSPVIDRSLHGLYIDDCILLSPRNDLPLFNAIVSAYRKVRLPPSDPKCIKPSRSPVTVLGVDIDGTNYSISLSISRLLKTMEATTSLLSQKLVTGQQLSVILGSWTWPMLLRRASLAAFKHCYTFCERYMAQPHRLWPCVRRELHVVMNLAPLFRVNLKSPIWSSFVATDASSIGAGIVSSTLSPQLYTLLWNSSSHPECGLLPLPLPASHMNDEPRDPLWWLLQPVQEYRAESVDSTQVTNSIIDEVSSAKWSTIVSSTWKFSAHINELEFSSVLLALRWLLSFPSVVGSRVVLLTDSTSVLFGVGKGRSSSPIMLSLLRRLSALLLSSNILLNPVWVPSELNPADSPSRNITSRTGSPCR